MRENKENRFVVIGVKKEDLEEIACDTGDSRRDTVGRFGGMKKSHP